MMKAVNRWAIVLGLVLAGAGSAVAREPLQRQAPGGPQEERAVTPAEIQRMFDAYALLQAQQQLKIGDDQYTQFLTRFKTLQDVRRAGLQQRTRMIQDLRRMLDAGQLDDASIKERLKALDELEIRSAADVKRAAEAIDQVLDLRQQAKFRVFQEQMEQRKLELVTRARLATRAKQQP
jgi:Spy/CpxP family protein refolding chaperone